MAKHRAALPQLEGGLFLAYTGMETDLLFTRGVDLPGFAAYPLLDTAEGRRLLRGYFRDLIAVARAHGAGAILESPTWVANRDRGAALGHAPGHLRAANRQAIALMAGGATPKATCPRCSAPISGRAATPMRPRPG